MNREDHWREIEEEYGASVEEVIKDLRDIDGGNTWRTVAGCLGVHPATLLRWRHALGMHVAQHDNRYDPSSFEHGVRPEHMDHRARELGFDSAADAIRYYRLVGGKTYLEVADILQCSEETVRVHTPDEIKYVGLYNKSEAWHEKNKEAWGGNWWSEVGVVVDNSILGYKRNGETKEWYHAWTAGQELEVISPAPQEGLQQEQRSPDLQCSG